MKKLLYAAIMTAVFFTCAVAVELKPGHVNEPARPWQRDAELAAMPNAERTNGRVMIKAYLSGVLGTEVELLEQAVTGGLFKLRFAVAVRRMVADVGAYTLPAIPFLTSAGMSGAAAADADGLDAIEIEAVKDRGYGAKTTILNTRAVLRNMPRGRPLS